jgi:acyl-CoA thioesterase-1
VPPRLQPGIPITALGATSYVAFGDSITYGTLSSFDGTYLYDGTPQSYPTRLQLGLNSFHAPQVFTVANDGLPGETAAGGATRIASVLAARRPQVLLLLEGINDLSGATTAARTASSVLQIVQIARLYNCTVLVATMFQTYAVTRPDGSYRDNGSELVVPFNTELRRAVAGLQNVYVVDVYSAFGSNPTYVGNDGLHPTPEGYQRMAQEFMSAIETIFRVRGSLQ